MANIIELPNQRAESVEKSPLKIRQFFTLASENQADVKIWVRKSIRDSEPLALAGQVVDFDSKTGTIEVKLSEIPELPSVPATAATMVQVLVYMKRGGVVGFVANAFEIEKRRFRVKQPERIFRIHRRKDERYELPRGIEILVRLPNPLRPMLTNQRRLHDISAGGISVEIGATEARDYTKGRFLSKVKLAIQGREIIFSGQIQGQGETKFRKAGVRLGIAFRKISDADRDFIRTYVLEHMIQYLSRLDY